jgi:hypothetical protein
MYVNLIPKFAIFIKSIRRFVLLSVHKPGHLAACPIAPIEVLYFFPVVWYIQIQRSKQVIVVQFIERAYLLHFIGCIKQDVR